MTLKVNITTYIVSFCNSINLFFSWKYRDIPFSGCIQTSWGRLELSTKIGVLFASTRYGKNSTLAPQDNWNKMIGCYYYTSLIWKTIPMKYVTWSPFICFIYLKHQKFKSLKLAPSPQYVQLPVFTDTPHKNIMNALQGTIRWLFIYTLGSIKWLIY